MPSPWSTPHSDPAPEALVCAAQIASREGRFDDARRACADAFEIVERADDLLLAATTWAVAMEVEADRVEAVRLLGPRGQADATAAQVAADEMYTRARDVVRRLEAGGVFPQPDAVAQLAVAEAERDRVWARYDPDPVVGHRRSVGGPQVPVPGRSRPVPRSRPAAAGPGNRERAAAAARDALGAAERLPWPIK